MNKIISGIKAYKENLKTQSDFWLLITAYGWIFLICLSVGLILVLFNANKDAETTIKFGVYFFIGIFINIAILVAIKTIAGKKD